MQVREYNEGEAFVFGNQTETSSVADFFKTIWVWIIGCFTVWGWPEISIPQVDSLFIVLIIMAILMIVIFKIM